jgi:hypothetical protein
MAVFMAFGLPVAFEVQRYYKQRLDFPPAVMLIKQYNQMLSYGHEIRMWNKK